MLWPFCWLLLGFAGSLPAAPLDVKTVPEVPNTDTPQILYWFWTPKTLENDQYLQDIERIAKRSRFDMVFITGREGLINLGDQADHLRPVLEKAVAKAHSLGLKMGLQLWSPNSDLKNRLQAITADGEVTLDANGNADYTGTGTGLRNVGLSSALGAGMEVYVRSEVLKVYTFKKTADGFYDPASLKELTGTQVQSASGDSNTVAVHIAAGPAAANATAFVLTAHYCNAGDMFSNYFDERFRQFMTAFKGIPFDGMALDEFKYSPVEMRPTAPIRGRYYSQGMAAAFQARHGQELARALFDGRYAPQGNPGVRAQAINRYFDLFCFRVADVDQTFQDNAKEIFGPHIFIGVHNTFHNTLTSDEIWATGVNWWGLNRDYGQLDETVPDAVRLGVSLASPKPVFYNMYYSKKPDAYIDEAAHEARLNGREHYHAYNDTGLWGNGFQDDAFMDQVARVEKRIRLLNQFDGARADSRLLIVFGFPSLANWYPDESARNEFDVNGKQDVFGKATAAWKAGYPCALVSSAVIDLGRLKLDAQNRPVMNGHTFDAVVFLNPQYSKEATFSFLEKYVAGGGKLMLEGQATQDFDGHDVSARFEHLAQGAASRSFSVKGLAGLGIKQDWPKDGSRLEDGSVIVVDRASIDNDTPHTFEFAVGSDKYTAVCSGLLAFKAGPNGTIDKLAAARFEHLERNGQTVLASPQPVDLVLRQDAAGQYHATVAADADPGLKMP